MKKFLPAVAGVLAMASVSTAALANERDDLTEVEVSLWEIVASVTYYALDNGDVALTEYNKQLDDVATFWADFKTEAGPGMAPGIPMFEEAYSDVVEHAKLAVDATTAEARLASVNDMWRAAHLADDVLDLELKAKISD